MVLLRIVAAVMVVGILAICAVVIAVAYAEMTGVNLFR